MGTGLNPGQLSDSGERCLRRIIELYETGLPAPHLITAYGTAVEIHVSEMVERLVRISPISMEPFGRELIKEVGANMISTWPQRHRWIRRGFDVDYTGTAAAEKFSTLVELRNAIVHGDGSWSRHQRNDAVGARVALRRSFMNTLDVAMQNEAKFGTQSREKATVVVRDFVSVFDQAVLSKYPVVRASPPLT